MFPPFTTKHFHFAELFFTKITSQKCWFGLCFKGCTLFLTPQNRFWALFAKSAQHCGNLRFGGKVRFLRKSALFRLGKYISGPIAQTLIEPMLFLGVLGPVSHFFALFHQIPTFLHQNRFCAETHFCAEKCFFAFLGAFLDPFGTFAQTLIEPMLS